MLGRLSSDLYRYVNWKWVVVAAIVFGCFIAFVLPWQAEKSKEETGGGESPDSSFLYSADDLYRMAEHYGESGRSAYIQARFTFDMIWPAGLSVPARRFDIHVVSNTSSHKPLEVDKSAALYGLGDGYAGKPGGVFGHVPVSRANTCDC